MSNHTSGNCPDNDHTLRDAVEELMGALRGLPSWGWDDKTGEVYRIAWRPGLHGAARNKALLAAVKRYHAAQNALKDILDGPDK